jgi:hypothetical protein
MRLDDASAINIIEDEMLRTPGIAKVQDGPRAVMRAAPILGNLSTP